MQSLEAALGSGPVSTLLPLPVDLRAGYRKMGLFIAALNDTDQMDPLGRAIGGRGAFRRFKDQLATWPDLLDQWCAFSEDRQRGRARAWLAAAGYAPAPPPPRS